MNRSIINLIAFLFLAGIGAGCANAQIVPDRDRPEPDFTRCKKIKLTESEVIEVRAHFMRGRGCHLVGVSVNKKYLKKGNPLLSKTVLAALGWENASRREREKLAILLVERVFFAFSADSKQVFRAVTSEGGGIKVIVSLQYPPGVTSRHAPKIFDFDQDGNSAATGDY